MIPNALTRFLELQEETPWLTLVIDITNKPWNPYVCVDCNVDTTAEDGIAEYYNVHNFVWCEAFGFDPLEVLDKNGRYFYDYIDQAQNVGMLCIGCLERRIGRELEADDFSDAPINWNQGRGYIRSERFEDRLSRRSA